MAFMKINLANGELWVNPQQITTINTVHEQELSNLNIGIMIDGRLYITDIIEASSLGMWSEETIHRVDDALNKTMGIVEKITRLKIEEETNEPD